MGEEKIRKIVRILKENFSNFKQEHIIEDLEKSIEDFGIEVRYALLEDEISGFSRVVDGKPQVIVNGEHPENRRRFTMAHELGHIILHWKWLNKENQRLDDYHYEILYRQESSYYNGNLREEIQANAFAAEFLMPIEDVKKMLKGKQEKDLSRNEKSYHIKKLAHKYRVSDQTARIQLEKAFKLNE
ncbi:MAG TPA: ImmA/IrrE family metallo-endopeptidase [Cerasibacillus sp.]|uniref:ImmA/IrrE family metallo-endopeptidase n=1 Tax=Cerasibacillus sp. TaxID=2498711 RepID=UPI002F419FE9